MAHLLEKQKIGAIKPFGQSLLVSQAVKTPDWVVSQQVLISGFLYQAGVCVCVLASRWAYIWTTGPFMGRSNCPWS